VYLDKYANEADAIVVINRVKPHVAFRGPCESGLMKMITIGMGKQKGADFAHMLGFGEMAETVPAIARVTIEKKKHPVCRGHPGECLSRDRKVEVMRERNDRDPGA
jgi:hypothetical protein